MKRALITGAAGQDGTYLTELLLSKGYEVWGVIGPEPGDYLAWAAEQGEHLHPCEADLADAESLDRLIAEVVPDEVYNFAGISSVALSWECPTLVADINATGVARLIEAIRTHAPEARLLPGDLGRDLRQRRGVAPDRVDADPPDHAVRRRRRRTRTSSSRTRDTGGACTHAARSSTTTSRPGGLRRS